MHLLSIAVLNIIENLNLIDNLVEVEEVCGLERLAIVAEAHAGQLPLCWSTGESKYRVFFTDPPCFQYQKENRLITNQSLRFGCEL